MRLQLTRAGAVFVAGALFLTTSSFADQRPRRARVAAPEPAEDEEQVATKGGASIGLSGEMTGYTDTDAVQVLSPTVAIRVGDEVAGWSVNARYLLDAVSAASVDVTSAASGKWKEYRHVGSAGLDVQGEVVSVSLSGNVSREPDYLSLTGGGLISIAMFDKNVTPYLGGSYGLDSVGRTGEPKDQWQALRRYSSQTGATFTVDRSTIAAIGVDAIFERGYLAKPYRYVPIFAPGEAAMVGPGAPAAFVNEHNIGRAIDTVPNHRDRYALSGHLAHRFDSSTIRIDERGYTDSWGLMASTTDGRIIFDAGKRVQLWPHLRFHVQSGVSFWERAYEAPIGSGDRPGVLTYRTGDRELGPLTTSTGGLGLRWRLSDDGKPPWALFLQGDASYTRYYDAIYITHRLALFTSIGIEAQLD